MLPKHTIFLKLFLLIRILITLLIRGKAKDFLFLFKIRLGKIIVSLKEPSVCMFHNKVNFKEKLVKSALLKTSSLYIHTWRLYGSIVIYIIGRLICNIHVINVILDTLCLISSLLTVNVIENKYMGYRKQCFFIFSFILKHTIHYNSRRG